MTVETILQRLALVMAVNCVRNTVVEDYHAQDKLTQAEMRRLNQQVVNKLYTFLTYLFRRPHAEQAEFLQAMELAYPKDWDPPQLDPDLLCAIEVLRTLREDTP